MTTRHNISDTVQALTPDTAGTGIKLGIAAGGTAASWLTLNEWVALATLIYVLAQTGLLVPKYVAMYRTWRAGKTIKTDSE